MRFSEAIEHLLNGEYIRRSKWHKDYYIKLEDEVIVDSDEMNTSVSTEDIIANDWELYQHKLDISTVIQYNMTVQSELCLVYLNQIRNTPF